MHHLFVRHRHQVVVEETACSARHHILIHQENGEAVTRIVPLDYFGDLQTEYEKRNMDYIERYAVKKYHAGTVQPEKNSENFEQEMVSPDLKIRSEGEEASEHE